MLRLNLTSEPRWRAFGHGVRRRTAPLATALMVASRSDAAVDARCGVDLDDPAYKGTGSVVALTGDRSFTPSGLAGFTTGWFTLGRVTWTSGANAVRTTEVASHDVVAGACRLTLLEAPLRPIEVGDDYIVRAGCDKRLETCRARFANVVKFRGGPHIPGPDTVIRYLNHGDSNTGDVL